MKIRKVFLAIVLLSLSFCFVSGVGYGVIDEELSDMIKVSRMEYLLLEAEVKYIMRNPASFSDIDFWYDAHGFGRLFIKWPIGIDTKKKIVVDIRDSRNIFLNKSGVALLEVFKKELDVIYSFINDIATSMTYDIVARFNSKGDIPLGYFYEGEYHLWEE